MEVRFNEKYGGNESDKGDLMDEIQEHPAGYAASMVNDKHHYQKKDVVEEDDETMEMIGTITMAPCSKKKIG